MDDALRSAAQRAADLIAGADALIVTAGAGMGVDSGLPDFRGPEGFWNAYPALGRARLCFEEIANPQAFEDDPRLAWGFYGHRLNLYRQTVPHEGFRVLLDLAARLPHGAFVFTSNVDGQFQQAGFDEARIVECHGSIHHLQCLHTCGGYIWSADDLRPVIGEEDCRLVSPLPECPLCGTLARPNILMFGDWGWVDTRSYAQQQRFRRWRQEAGRPVVIEIGAGLTAPSVRHFGESQRCPLIRINPRDWPVQGRDQVALPMDGLAGLQAIAGLL
ncbi:SIR2 family NAD-dependent protein deacylase [Pseudothauera rhizosphaerae]|uniref:protein acetyllysine N-acetyltransferase n=1 Tax=Pseudothauera rhizosphaerae TaxID=2565932 RepID=A0A4S4B0A1_9RHOO|nr:Sir2 family NAD-dependent protein deacetylase [Pseudothauera rhizosphaerae]THF64285.1 NAD-dependent deacetylase [Pseudothauera rhizosphaerae]